MIPYIRYLAIRLFHSLFRHSLSHIRYPRLFSSDSSTIFQRMPTSFGVGAFVVLWYDYCGDAMSWDRERAELIRRYMLEKYGYDMPLEEIQQMNLYQFNVTWFDALAYFRLLNHYPRLEDVPLEKRKEGEIIYIREDGRRVEYRFEEGEWRPFQVIEDEVYKE